MLIYTQTFTDKIFVFLFVFHIEEKMPSNSKLSASIVYNSDNY